MNHYHSDKRNKTGITIAEDCGLPSHIWGFQLVILLYHKRNINHTRYLHCSRWIR